MVFGGALACDWTLKTLPSAMGTEGKVEGRVWLGEVGGWGCVIAGFFALDSSCCFSLHLRSLELGTFAVLCVPAAIMFMMFKAQAHSNGESQLWEKPLK